MSTVRAESNESLIWHKLLWTGVIVALLALQILMCALAAFLATSDTSTVIESDYHDRALRWDATMAAVRASDALGWKAVVLVDPKPNVLGERQVKIVLTDSKGLSLVGVDVQLTLFHHAHAGEVQKVSMAPSADASGEYVATIPMRHGGLWELRIAAHRGNSVFQRVTNQDIP